MGHKPKKGPKPNAKSKAATAANKTMPLQKSLCLAQSEVTDQNDPSIATTLRPYSRSRGTTNGSHTPLLHLPTDDEPPPLERR